jgi:flagellar biosynthetic protein FliP
MRNKLLRFTVILLLITLVTGLLTVPALAAAGEGTVGGGPGTQEPNLQINIGGQGSDTVRIILLMTVLTLMPSILIMMTSFVRIIVVFSLLRNAIGTQQTPPNQVLIGLALMLTLFIMNPVITQVNETAYAPYSAGEIDSEEFLSRASVPVKGFMLGQVNEEDIDLFYTISGRERPAEPMEYPMDIVIPSFILGELKRAFMIGFLLYIPFLIIDMVVASALMSMGMMMLPPVTISLPFKLMLFVLVDGWGLLIRALISTYT